eukprot:2850213-Rhodomonas_salina.2
MSSFAFDLPTSSLDDLDGGTVLARCIEPRCEHYPLVPLTVDSVRLALQTAPEVVRRWMSLKQLGFLVQRPALGETEYFLRFTSHSLCNYLPSALLQYRVRQESGLSHEPLSGIMRRMLRKHRTRPRQDGPVEQAHVGVLSDITQLLAMHIRNFRQVRRFDPLERSQLPTSSLNIERGSLGRKSRYFRPASTRTVDAYGHLDGTPVQLDPSRVQVITKSLLHPTTFGDMHTVTTSGLSTISHGDQHVTLDSEGTRWYDIMDRHS